MDSLQRRLLPSFSALRCFEAAARHESFTLAANELNLSQSAISRQVKDLESRLAAQLFRRTGRKVVLTRAGTRLASDISVELENMRRIMMRAASTGNKHVTLRVAVLPTFASLWLIPRLPDFFERHPDIEINASTRLKPFDLEAEHFDLAIHHGEKNWPNTDMRKLFSEMMIPVASPKFMKENNITSLADVHEPPLIHLSSRPSAWPDFMERVGLRDRSFVTGRYFDQFSMVIAAARAALGIALLPRYLIEKELFQGSLIAISDAAMVTRNSYYFVTPASQQDENVEKFYRWIAKQTTQNRQTQTQSF